MTLKISVYSRFKRDLTIKAVLPNTPSLPNPKLPYCLPICEINTNEINVIAFNVNYIACHTNGEPRYAKL